MQKALNKGEKAAVENPGLMIGKVINERYDILEKIGQGGMASVYRARDLNLGREVAIKVLNESIASDPDFHERFRREARAASVLSNPNIIQVYDYLETSQGTFIVMELVRGEDLRTLLKRGGRLSLDRSISIAIDVLNALMAAHQNGLVHRDISARNVLIGANEEVKVSDFGIARVLGERTLTQTGELIGSVEYISPEQANGDEADARSDIYAVGVLLYQMLTGVLPFTADTAVRLAIKHIQETPKRPSELRPEISTALDDIVMCALEKDPQNRFESAEKMSEALDSLRYVPSDSLADDDDDELEATLVRPNGWNDDYESYEEDSGEYLPEELYHDNISEKQPKKRGKVGLMLGVMLTVFVAIVAGVSWVLVYSVPRIDVVSVEGEPIEAAIATLEQMGFKTNITEQRTVEGVAEGIVVEQNPKAGTKLAQGSVVYLVVSRSKDSVFLPNFVGMPLDVALKELQRLNIQANIVHTDDVSVPPNTVVGQEPSAGSKVVRSSFVTLTISDDSHGITVPKLVGMSLDEAIKVVSKLGASIIIKEVDGENGPIDTVLRQDPSPDAKIEKGGKITVMVASKSNSSAVMPNLVGRTVAAARSEAKALGLELIVEGGGDGNAVISGQRPAAGEVVEDGKAYVSSFSMAVVPDLNGVSYENAVENLHAAGLVVGNVSKSYEDNVAGIVVQQYPSGGIEAEYGSSVDITVSALRPAEPEPAPVQQVAPVEPAPVAEPTHHEAPARHEAPVPSIPSGGEGAAPTPALELPGDLPSM